VCKLIQAEIALLLFFLRFNWGAFFCGTSRGEECVAVIFEQKRKNSSAWINSALVKFCPCATVIKKFFYDKKCVVA
jgi:hypothetical protein